MNITIVNGNILDAKEDYILQQNCCTALRACGLSAAIAERYGVNPYKDRKPASPRLNWARLEDRPIQGTIYVSGRIICMYAQYRHGQAQRNVERIVERNVQRKETCTDPCNTTISDTPSMRIVYFVKCLEQISHIENITSVAIPYGIGCGLAGGHWETYEKYIRSWAAKHPTIKVVLYKL